MNTPWDKTIVTYRRWRNPETRNEAAMVSQNDEDQSTDGEICTIASHTGGSPASSCGSNHHTTNQATFTVDDAVEAFGFGKFQWKLSIVTGVCWVADAMEMMILSILGPELRCDWRLPSIKVASITAVVFFGMGISSAVWGSLNDKYGRRACLIVCMLWTFHYGLLTAFAPTFGWTLFLRALVGFGLGGAPQAVTLYSEFLSTKSRGISITCIAVFFALGAVFEVLLALMVMPTLGWRWLVGLSTIPIGIFLILCLWLPESARFDLMCGKREKALITLARIAKDNGKEMPPGQLIAKEESARGRISSLFTPQYRTTTLLLWIIWFVSTFCYYGIILLTTELLQDGNKCEATHGTSTEPECNLECKYLTTTDYIHLLWTTLAEFPGLFIALAAVDYIGRKKSMAMCFAIYTLSLVPIYFCIGKIATSIFIFVGRAFVAGGFQVAYIYTPEVFPTETRAMALGTCSGISRIGALLTPFVAQVILQESLYLAISIYCFFSVLATIVALLLPIETSGKPLVESSVFS